MIRFRVFQIDAGGEDTRMGLELGGGAQRVMQALAAVVLVVAALYFGREILIPLSMAVLLTFLLGPLVTWLERRRLPRPVAVILVMGSIAVVAGSATWAIASQFRAMAGELEDYRKNLKEKVASLRFDGDPIGEVQKTIQEVSGAATDEEAAALQSPEIQPVRVVADEAVPFDRLALFTSTVLTPLANAAIIVVLVLFMLLKREDLRNRIVRLAGTRLTLTTRTLDEIATRISRYLLMSSIINGSFGLAVAAGLWAIGVHYALLWGFLAGLLRYVPYVGPAMGAMLPLTMAFIQFPDWTHLALTAGLFLVLELITNNVAEPLLYGQSAGVSTVALLVSVTFWTWVWGPMGLVLAVPLTVVMAVLGEHVPALQPLGILLGDKPPLASFVSYYQRLLARDVEEASSILDEQFQEGGLAQVYDQVLVPALVLAEKDHQHGDLPTEARQSVWEATREFIDDYTPAEAEGQESESGPGLRAHVLGCPAHDEADVLALAMLDQLVPARGGQLEVLSASMLAAELVARIAEDPPDAVCVSSLGPVGLQQARYLCKRLRQASPELRIIVGRWGHQGDRELMADALKRCGADQVVATLAEAGDLLVRLQAASAASRETPAKPAA
jgi:predicted PurR-regulated permease PerM